MIEEEGAILRGIRQSSKTAPRSYLPKDKRELALRHILEHASEPGKKIDKVRAAFHHVFGDSVPIILNSSASDRYWKMAMKLRKSESKKQPKPEQSSLVVNAAGDDVVPIPLTCCPVCSSRFYAVKGGK